MAQFTVEDLFNKKNRRNTITAIVIILIVGIFLIVLAVQPQPNPNARTDNASTLKAELNKDTAEVSLIKDILTVYYVSYNNYPVLLSQLTDDMAKNPSAYDNTDTKTFNDAVAWLRDFKYTVRGDDQSYKVSYINSAGKTITSTVSYRNDYQ